MRIAIRNEIELWKKLHITLIPHCLNHYIRFIFTHKKASLSSQLSSMTIKFHKIFIKISNWNRHFPNGFIHWCPISKYCYTPYDVYQVIHHYYLFTAVSKTPFSYYFERFSELVKNLPNHFFVFVLNHIKHKTCLNSNWTKVKTCWWSICIIFNRVGFVSKH